MVQAFFRAKQKVRIPMSFLEMVGKIPGFDVRSQKVGNTETVSITGSAKAIGYGLKFAMLVGLVSMSQIVRFGIRQDGQNGHLVLLKDREYGLSQTESQKIELIAGYFYAHQITALDQGVNAAIFDKGFNPMTNEAIGKAFGQFAAAIFDNGKVRGEQTNTMLLWGRSNQDRVLVASQWGKQNPLQLIGTTLRGDTRYSSVQDNTILCAQNGTGNIAALHVDSIIQAFKTSKSASWQTTQVAGASIEDFTPSIGDKATVLLTATIDGRRVLVPANVIWTKKDDTRKVTLQLAPTYAVDLPDTKSPVVRLGENTLTMVGGSDVSTVNALSVETIDTFGNEKQTKALRRIAREAASGEIYQQAA